jgi:uncharacterized membrane protein
MQRHATSPLWGRLGLLGAVFGAVTVLVAAWTFVEFSYFHDSGWVYAADMGTVTMALAGYVLLFLAVLTLRQASGTSAQPSQSRASA